MGLDKEYPLTVSVGQGSLAVDTVLAQRTRGRAVIWAKKPGAARWEMLTALPRNENAVFNIGSADLYRNAQVLLVFELKEDAEIGTWSRFEAVGELLLDGSPVPGSRQRIRGTFDRPTRIEAINWTIQ